MRQLYFKYKKMIRYLIFGILTTLINIITYGVATRWFLISASWSTIIAWVISVLFAYVTNGRFVFESKANIWSEKIREMLQFFSCRVATGVLDLAIMYIFVDLLNMQDILIKCGSNIIVIIANYAASKRIVFKK